MSIRVGKIWFGITALVGLLAIIGDVILTAGETAQHIAESGGNHGHADQYNSVIVRALIPFLYFTILSNIVVMVTNAMLVFRWERTSTVFRSFRLFAIIGIFITGVIYNGYLRFLSPQTGWNEFDTNLLHVFVPVATILGWLLFGPRIPLRMKYIWGALTIGLVWIIFTLIHGAIGYWYPYPFVDVEKNGLVTVLITCVVLLIIAGLLGWAAMGLDKILPDRNRAAKAETPAAQT